MDKGSWLILIIMFVLIVGSAFLIWYNYFRGAESPLDIINGNETAEVEPPPGGSNQASIAASEFILLEGENVSLSPGNISVTNELIAVQEVGDPFDVVIFVTLRLQQDDEEEVIILSRAEKEGYVDRPEFVWHGVKFVLVSGEGIGENKRVQIRVEPFAE